MTDYTCIVILLSLSSCLLYLLSLLLFTQGTISMEGLIHSKLPEIDNLMNNKSFRYAALNLAHLHANFGHKQQAVNI